MFCRFRIRRYSPRCLLALYVTLSALFTLTLSVQAEPTRSPVTNGQMFTALQKARLPTEGAEISIAAAITASVPGAELELISMLQLSPSMVRLRVTCENRAQCIPFYAFVTWPRAVSLGQSRVAMLGSRDKRKMLKPSSGSDEDTATQIAAKLASDGGSGIAMRSGAFATLLLEDGRIHIRMQVVCQQDGSFGDKIRVTTPDHKKSYVAEVLAPSLLRGDL